MEWVDMTGVPGGVKKENMQFKIWRKLHIYCGSLQQVYLFLLRDKEFFFLKKANNTLKVLHCFNSAI